MTDPIPGDAIFQNPGGVFSAGNPAFIITAISSGTAHTLHTAVTGTDDLDLVTVWVYNTTSTNYTLTVEVGGVQMGPITVMRNALPAIIFARMPMNNGTTLKAYADTTAVLGVCISTTRVVNQAQ